MSKVLVTGGAGYKGVLLAEALLERGEDVTILDNFMYGYDAVLHLVRHPRLTVVNADIRNIDEQVVRDFDVVYHLAGISGYPACEANPHSAKLINVDASRKLGESLSDKQLLIYASTTSFYGKKGERCDETTPVEPVSLYGMTKYQAEEILMQRANTVALRFATLFGVSPRMRIDLLVNDFAHKAVNDRCLVLFESRTKRTFLHVRDAVRAYLMAWDRAEDMAGTVVNVGDNDMNFSKMDIAQAVRKYTGCKIIDSDMKDFDVRDFVIAFDKIAGMGFRASISLDEGIAELCKLYAFYRPLATYRTI